MMGWVSWLRCFLLAAPGTGLTLAGLAFSGISQQDLQLSH